MKSILESSGVIKLLHPYEKNVSNRAVKTPKISGKTFELGCILCQYDKALYLSEDVISLPIEYILIFIAVMTFSSTAIFKSQAMKKFDSLDRKFIEIQKSNHFEKSAGK